MKVAEQMVQARMDEDLNTQGASRINTTSFKIKWLLDLAFRVVQGLTSSNAINETHHFFCKLDALVNLCQSKAGDLLKR